MSEHIEENGASEEPVAPPEPAETGMGVAVYQGLPDVTMVVNEGNVVSPAGDDRMYEAGETFTVDGPAAIALAAAGHASPAPSGAPAENGAPEEAPAE